MLDASRLSNWFLVFFIIVVGGTATYSDLFEISKNNSEDSRLIINPLSINFLNNIETIVIKNRIDTYELVRKKHNSDFTDSESVQKLNESIFNPQQWLLEKPNKFPVQKKAIEKIILSIKNIKINKSFEKDSLNLSNLSFEKPVLQIDLRNKKNETRTLKLGFINPLDNSAYVTFSDKDAIYEISNLEYPLETLELTDIIDTSIINTNISELADIEFYSYLSNKKKSVEKLKSNLFGEFINTKGKSVNSENLERYLEELSEIKSKRILINNSEKIVELIDKKLNPPHYEIDIIKKDSKKVNLKISWILNRVYDLKVDRKQYFIIKSSNREYPFLVHKKYLDKIKVRRNSF